eukprot:GHVH01011483.1.p1 GENE.GHVH01011483.1~~GHVH01011483.1.p1  ORF type:complete len:368 (+),score=71.80 GHVH01011483.1:163-1104(+)
MTVGTEYDDGRGSSTEVEGKSLVCQEVFHKLTWRHDTTSGSKHALMKIVDILDKTNDDDFTYRDEKQLKHNIRRLNLWLSENLTPHHLKLMEICRMSNSEMSVADRVVDLGLAEIIDDPIFNFIYLGTNSILSPYLENSRYLQQANDSREAEIPDTTTIKKTIMDRAIASGSISTVRSVMKLTRHFPVLLELTMKLNPLESVHEDIQFYLKSQQKAGKVGEWFNSTGHHESNNPSRQGSGEAQHAPEGFSEEVLQEMRSTETNAVQQLFQNAWRSQNTDKINEQYENSNFADLLKSHDVFAQSTIPFRHNELL